MIITKEEFLERLNNDNDITKIVMELVEVKIDTNFLKLLREKGLRGTTEILQNINDDVILDIDLLINECDIILNKYDSEIQLYMRKVIKEIGLTAFFLDHECILFNKDNINKFGINSIIRLYKYAYLPYNKDNDDLSSNIDFDILFDKDNIERFLIIYENILNENILNLDIRKFVKVAALYLKNKNLFDEILNKKISSEMLNKLRVYFLYQNKESEFNIQSIEDLMNLNEYIKKPIESQINFVKEINGKDKAYFYEIILNAITGDENILLFFSSLSREKIDDLINNLEYTNDNEEDFIFLSNLKLLLEIMNKCKNINLADTEKFVDEFLTNLNDQEKFILYDVFKDCKARLNSIYGKELMQNLTDVKKLSIDIKEKNETSSILIENYKGEEVDYIIAYDPVFFIQHVMNAYNKNYEKGKIDIFARGKRNLIGSTIFSTSTINNDSQEYLDSSKDVGEFGKHEIKDINDVVLLFDKITPSNLVCFGSGDCQVQIRNFNELDHVSSWTAIDLFKYDTANKIIEEAVKKEEAATEYVFYFENENGEIMKPSAIRVMSDEPNEHEIAAAKFLNIPLIKLEKTERKRKTILAEKKRLKIKSSQFKLLRKIYDIFDKILLDKENREEQSLFDETNFEILETKFEDEIIDPEKIAIDNIKIKILNKIDFYINQIIENENRIKENYIILGLDYIKKTDISKICETFIQIKNKIEESELTLNSFKFFEMCLSETNNIFTNYISQVYLMHQNIYNESIKNKIIELIYDLEAGELNNQIEYIKSEKCTMLEKMFGKLQLNNAMIKQLEVQKKNLINDICKRMDGVDSISYLIYYIKNNGLTIEMKDFLQKYIKLPYIKEKTDIEFILDNKIKNGKNFFPLKTSLFKIKELTQKIEENIKVIENGTHINKKDVYSIEQDLDFKVLSEFNELLSYCIYRGNQEDMTIKEVDTNFDEYDKKRAELEELTAYGKLKYSKIIKDMEVEQNARKV